MPRKSGLGYRTAAARAKKRKKETEIVHCNDANSKFQNPTCINIQLTNQSHESKSQTSQPDIQSLPSTSHDNPTNSESLSSTSREEAPISIDCNFDLKDRKREEQLLKWRVYSQHRRERIYKDETQRQALLSQMRSNARKRYEAKKETHREERLQRKRLNDNSISTICKICSKTKRNDDHNGTISSIDLPKKRDSKGMGCSASNCSNSARKGFKMFSFPSGDPER